MRQSLKWIGLGIGGLLIVLVVAVGGALLFLDWNWFKDTIVAEASDATGRKVVIDGDVGGELALVPRIRIGGLRIENAQWARQTATDMVRVRDLAFRIDLLELLRGRMVLLDVAIAGAVVSLEKRKDGTANWNFGPSVAGAAAEAAVPEDRTEFPVIRNLVIDDSRISYLDPGENIDIEMKLSSVDADGGAERTVRLSGKGKYDGQDLELNLTAGTLLRLRDGGDPYPIDLALDVGKTSLKARGTATAPLDFDGLDVQIELKGRSLSDLFTLTRIPLPPTGAYSLAGRLGRKGERWSFRKFDGRVGKSDLAGDAEMDFAPDVPSLKAKLTSRRLDIADLGGLIGAPPDKETPTKSEGRVLPDMKIALNRLRAMNMQVGFKAQRIIAPGMPIDDLSAKLFLENGVLTLEPLTFGVAGGTLSGPLVLDGSRKIPQVRTDLTMRGMSLKPFLAPFEMADLTSGTLGGKITLAGQGRSLAEVLGSADGRVTLAMMGGTLNPLLVELIGLDIGQALAIVVTGGKPVEIRCLLGDLSAQRGTLKIRGFLIDTTDSNIWVQGGLDLGKEHLAVRAVANPKDPSLLSANAPISIKGPLKNPDVALDTLGSEGEGGVAEAIGKIVNPILALIPIVDLGLAKDTDCRQPTKPR